MTTTKAKPKGTLASLESVFVTFEPYLEFCLRQIINNDSAAFLQLHQKAALLSNDYFNKLRDSPPEGKVSALLLKARGANLQQLLKLVDFIQEQEKMGDSQTLRILKIQLMNRPAVPEPPFPRPKSRWDSAMQRQREKTVVLMDRVALLNKEDVKLAGTVEEEKNKTAEATARGDALQNENNNLREQLEYALSEMKKMQDENAKLQLIVEEVSKDSKTSGNYQTQAETYKAESEHYKAIAEAERQRADELKRERDEIRRELMQTKQNHALELDEIRKELRESQRQLDDKMKQLEKALQKNDSLERHVEKLEGDVKELKQQQHAQGEEAKATAAAVKDLQTARQRDEQVSGHLQTRHQLGARSDFELLFFKSLPAPRDRDVSLRTLFPPIEEK